MYVDGFIFFTLSSVTLTVKAFRLSRSHIRILIGAVWVIVLVIVIVFTLKLIRGC